MSEYKDLIGWLRYCASSEPICEKASECPFYDQMEEETHDYWCSERMMEKAADAIEELFKAAKAMHTWIFLNSGDEQKAYDECGLSDKMNAELGYYGRFDIERNEE